jgi:parvulin-like peptidyl-prolyl isomerase
MTFFPDLFGRFTLGGELAAKVNGNPITMQELNAGYERLPLEYKYVITKEMFLQQLIDETLLTEEAARQNLSVSEKEVDDSLASFMQTSNVTQEKLDQILKDKKLTYPELRSLVRNQLLVDKVLKELEKKVNVTTAQALQYYNDNPGTFKISELVTVKHILISISTRNDSEAEKRADQAFKELKSDKSNFCELVKQYSDDSGSTDKCGQYTFPKGQMVAEFEDRAFSQAIGNVSMVKTSFGYHILWTINKTPEQIVPFKDVQEQITSVLSKQQANMIYSDFIAKLRENAKIINYLEKKAEENKTEEKAVAEEPKLGEEAATQTQTQVTVIEAANKTEEKPVEEKPAEQPQLQLSFADCLTSQGAVLYGAYWDSSTKKQREYFGADIAKINYVECGVQGDYRAQASICKQAGILAYPTWIINDEKHMGIQELSQLAVLTSCKV